MARNLYHFYLYIVYIALYAWVTTLFRSPVANWQQVTHAGLSAGIIGAILVAIYLSIALREHLFSGSLKRVVPVIPESVELPAVIEPIITLYEREAAAITTLPPVLATYYGGGFTLPAQEVSTRPYVIANFVETLDGVISYNAPGQLDSKLISGDNAQDKLVMGLLRASADAVIFGSSSLQEDGNHLHIASFISPAFATEYDALRTQQGRKERWPISVIMTRSGHINLKNKAFHTPDLRVVIATTEQGSAYLAQQSLPPGVDVRTIEAGGKNTNEISPVGVLRLLARDYGVKVALYEGGPTLLASFLAEDVIDELFLTLAPQIVGREDGLHRLALVEGHAFMPVDALWATLLSVKLAGSHLLLRYRFTR